MPKRPPPKPTTKSSKPPRNTNRGPALTPRQAAFVAEYLVDMNGKQAAIRAGYSPQGAEVTASKLLRNPKVKARVEHGLTTRQERTEITQDRVLEELTILAHSCVDDYAVSPEGRLVPAEGRPQEVMRAVSSVKYRTRTVGSGEAAQVFHEVEFRLWDKPNTLKLEGRHTGLFPNEVKVDVGEGTLADVLKMAHQINAGTAG